MRGIFHDLCYTNYIGTGLLAFGGDRRFWFRGRVVTRYAEDLHLHTGRSRTRMIWVGAHPFMYLHLHLPVCKMVVISERKRVI